MAEKYRYYVDAYLDGPPLNLYRTSADGVEQYVKHRNGWVRLVEEAWEFVSPFSSERALPVSADRVEGFMATVPDKPAKFLEGLEA